SGDGIDVRNSDIVKLIVGQQVQMITVTGSAGIETIENNVIGTNYLGAQGLGNADDGIALDDTGFDQIGSGNVIAGSGRDGIRITANGGNPDSITQNDIGVDTA